MPLTVSPKKLPNDIDVLELTGKITMGNDCLQLQWRAEGLVAENRKKLVFDMSAISHVDSTGIGIIVMIAGKTKQTGGRITSRRVSGARCSCAETHIH
jgi:anti-anti-sigma regulatory factor